MAGLPRAAEEDERDQQKQEGRARDDGGKRPEPTAKPEAEAQAEAQAELQAEMQAEAEVEAGAEASAKATDSSVAADERRSENDAANTARARAVAGERRQHSDDAASSASESSAAQSVSLNEDAQVDTARSTSYVVSAERTATLMQIVERLCEKTVRLATSKRYKPLRDVVREMLRENRLLAGAVRERASVNVQVLEAASSKTLAAIEAGLRSSKVAVLDVTLESVHKLLEAGFLGTSDASCDPLCIDFAPNRERLSVILELACGALASGEDVVYTRIVQTLLAAFKNCAQGLHSATMLACVRSVFNIHLNARSTSVRGSAKAAIAQMVHLKYSKLNTTRLPAPTQREAKEPLARARGEDAVARSRSASSTLAPTIPLQSGEALAMTDAYLLFRALCKLSAKQDTVPSNGAADGAGSDAPGDGSSSSSNENASGSAKVRSTVLALELLRLALSTAADSMIADDRFVLGLRSYLLPSVLTNCLSTSVDVAIAAIELAEEVILRRSLRPFVKSEIGVLLTSVVFRFLEMPSAGAQRRRASLRLLRKLCSDAQTLMDLFVNYDCDLSAPQICSRASSVLSAVIAALYSSTSDFHRAGTESSEVPPGSHHAPSSEDRRDRENWKEGIEAIAAAIKSLRLWCHDFEAQHRALLGRSGANPAAEDSASGIAERSKHGQNGSLPRTPAASSVDHPDVMASHANDEAVASQPRFIEALRVKRKIEDGVNKFNAKPKAGIEYLLQCDIIPEKTPVAVARYLRNTEGLDATMIGEYLGEADAFNVEVMHAFTDTFDFRGLEFDRAIRKYLASFRLPGEAQKIDRIMEKFASAYCGHNEEAFANADTGYVLAYSIIMLNTDAHNPQVKNKMTKEGFLRNNRGIDDGADLPADFLGGIYDRIVEHEIKLSDGAKDKASDAALSASSAAGSSATDALDPALRAELFRRESERLLNETRVLFQSRAKSSAGGDEREDVYYTASNVRYARLLFEIVSDSFLSALALILVREKKDRSIISTCIESFEHALALIALFGMKVEQARWISALSQIGIGVGRLDALRVKNIECLQLIVRFVNEFAREEESAQAEKRNVNAAFSLRTASDRDADSTRSDAETEYLDWSSIVRAISVFQRIRAVALGQASRYTLTPKTTAAGILFCGRERSHHLTPELTSGYETQQSNWPGATAGDSSADTEPRAFAPSVSFSAIDASVAEVAVEIADEELEFLFRESHLLSIERLVELAKALVRVTEEELKGELPINSQLQQEVARQKVNSATKAPKLFSLQKVVEIVRYNMAARTRREWTMLWDVLQPLFLFACTHENEQVAMLSIEVLSSLGRAFILKDELDNFSYQRVFLRPLETAFGRLSARPALRNHLLSQTAALVNARGQYLRSGWKSVFGLLAAAADERNSDIMQRAFTILESIVKQHFGVYRHALLDGVSGLAAFSRCPTSASVALSALGYLGVTCVELLANGSIFRDEASSARDPMTPGISALASNDDIRSATVLIFKGSNEAHIAAWFPVLTSLAVCISDERLPVRSEAKTLLFRVLSQQGRQFDVDLWSLVFKGVVLPIFDDIRHASSSSDGQSATSTASVPADVAQWASTTGAECLLALVTVVAGNFTELRIFLPKILAMLRHWICLQHEVLAKEGVQCFQALVEQCRDSLLPSEWDAIIDLIVDLFRATLPVELFSPFGSMNDAVAASRSLSRHVSMRRMSSGAHAQRAQRPLDNRFEAEGVAEHAHADTAVNQEPNEEAQDAMHRRDADEAQAFKSAADSSAHDEKKYIDFKVVRTKCVVQLLLLDLAFKAVVSESYPALSTRQIIRLVDAVEESYLFAKEFNLNFELRFALWRAGFMNQIPNLLKQEMNGMNAVLHMMFWLCLDRFKDNGLAVPQIEPRLVALCERVMVALVQRAPASAPSALARATPASDSAVPEDVSAGKRSGISTSTSVEDVNGAFEHVELDEGSEAYQQRMRELPALIPAVAHIIHRLCELREASFQKYIQRFFNLIVALVEHDAKPIREAISHLMRIRFGPMLLERDENAADSSGGPSLSHSASMQFGREKYYGVELPRGIRIVVFSVDGTNNVARAVTALESTLRLKLPQVLGVRYERDENAMLVYGSMSAEELYPFVVSSITDSSVGLLSDGVPDRLRPVERKK
uniref:SEC7 domain-containing protein n=1 Tax=Erythrolobus australicus TaxID=1077150 RepID=A0A7S1XIT6_9RHOD|mmetsp:Transcript_3076/g.8512  ORF Transcript_3076/g.8512 Transcript_3076/m.8512 type:complete len:2145 (+) Transcript_3076:64-6498(+)